jgi:hypothetical protein
MSYNDLDGNNYESLEIDEYFDNYENVCLMIAVNRLGHCDIIEHSCTKDNKDIFSQEYVDKVWKYTVEHNLQNYVLGDIVRKISRSVIDPIDINDFNNKYLYESNNKSARNV